MPTKQLVTATKKQQGQHKGKHTQLSERSREGQVIIYPFSSEEESQVDSQNDLHCDFCGINRILPQHRN